MTAPLSGWPCHSSPRSAGGSWSSRRSTRGRKRGSRCAISVARRWRSCTASARTARPARTRSGVPKKIWTKPPISTSPRSMNWSSTKKASCWRSSDRSATKSVAANYAGAAPPPDGPAPGAKKTMRQPAKTTSRAGRDLPAAIAVGVFTGGLVGVTLVFAPRYWVVLCSGAILVASHEVVRRLHEAGYVIPVIPLLIGGQVTVWLTWPFHAAGALAGFGGTVVVCMMWRLFMHDPNPPDGVAEQASDYLRGGRAT